MGLGLYKKYIYKTKTAQFLHCWSFMLCFAFSYGFAADYLTSILFENKKLMKFVDNCCWQCLVHVEWSNLAHRFFGWRFFFLFANQVWSLPICLGDPFSLNRYWVRSCSCRKPNLANEGERSDCVQVIRCQRTVKTPNSKVFMAICGIYWGGGGWRLIRRTWESEVFSRLSQSFCIRK